MNFRRCRPLVLVTALACLQLAGCVPPDTAGRDRPPPQQAPVAAIPSSTAAPVRQNGVLLAPGAEPRVQIVQGAPKVAAARATQGGPGAYSLDFADADLREVVSQILGPMLGLSFTIDPAVRGTTTLHTARPQNREELLATVQSLLSSNGAALVSAGGLYRVVPAAQAGAAGSRIVPLRFVAAEGLAKVLQPLIGQGVRVAAEPGLNALVIAGDPNQLDMIETLVGNFDVDTLVGQSYALLPVSVGSAREHAEALQEALRGQAGAVTGGLVRVTALPRLNAVLVIASQPSYLEAARSVHAVLDRQRRAVVRYWRIYYLQNSSAEDVAYILQSAFTPNAVTAVPKSRQGGSARAGMLQQSLGRGSSAAGGGATGGGASGAAAGGASAGGSFARGGVSAAPLASGQAGATASAAPQSAANPLLGGLDQSGGSGNDAADGIRILPDEQNNALLINGTAQEGETIELMLRKIDILPMQVRIDATIAEVTLNDQLKYGTQFFFKGNGIVGILNNASTAVGNPAATVLGTSFPGFVLGGNGAGGAPAALSLLQAVTSVNVLSAPQLVVVDNEPARLQVGSLVPYLTASAQSTLTAGAPVVNSINYQPTGIILDVTPRVNSGGLVTLDVTQEVSDVDTTSPKASGIDSPTFQQRIVSSRVVVQDGQTIGIAGLIRDSASRGNEGLPWLKDVPLLGLFAGTQTNERGRTELLVLITPHVIRSQREVRDLTDDLREALPNAAAVPQRLRALPPSGAADPSARLRQHLAP